VDMVLLEVVHVCEGSIGIVWIPFIQDVHGSRYAFGVFTLAVIGYVSWIISMSVVIIKYS
jgi:hypothetical protein